MCVCVCAGGSGRRSVFVSVFVSDLDRRPAWRRRRSLLPPRGQRDANGGGGGRNPNEETLDERWMMEGEGVRWMERRSVGGGGQPQAEAAAAPSRCGSTSDELFCC